MMTFILSVNPIYLVKQRILNIIQYQYLINSLPMAKVLKLRQKIEQQKRACLLKKIKFYEYLINYNATIDIQISPSKNKTSNSFFPQVPYHSRITTIAASQQKEEGLPHQQRQKEKLKDFSTYYSQYTSPSSSRPSQELSHLKLGLKNLSGIVAKSMTPTSRSYRPTNSRKITVKSFINDDFSTKECKQKKSSFRRSSPRKRTYVGTIHYVKDKSLAQPIKYVPPRRKQSLAPWESDLSYF